MAPNDYELDIVASWIARRGLSDSLKTAIKNGLTGIRLIMKGDLHSVPQEVLSFTHDVKSFSPNTKIMIDLPGSKPRLSRVNEKVKIKQGQLLYLHNNSAAQIIANGHLYSEGLSDCFGHLRINDRLLINDDKTVFEIKEIDSDKVTIQLLSEDTNIISYRSISLPDSDIHYHALTNYDIQALQTLVGTNYVDSVALSMVTNNEEILRGKEIIHSTLGNVEIIAKIETPDALKNIVSICESADSVMIARGDMRALCQPELLFSNQQTVINTAKQKNTDIIVATGLLASLGSSTEPSISELCDIGFFISNGIHRFLIADADLTLNHPERACEWIKKISNTTQRWRTAASDLQ